MTEIEGVLVEELHEKNRFIEFQKTIITRQKTKIENQRVELNQMARDVEKHKTQTNILMAKMEAIHIMNIEKEEFFLDRESRLNRTNRMLKEALEYIKLLENKIKSSENEKNV